MRSLCLSKILLFVMSICSIITWATCLDHRQHFEGVFNKLTRRFLFSYYETDVNECENGNNGECGSIDIWGCTNYGGSYKCTCHGPEKGPMVEIVQTNRSMFPYHVVYQLQLQLKQDSFWYSWATIENCWLR